jgi:hypothetical protein
LTPTNRWTGSDTGTPCGAGRYRCERALVPQCTRCDLESRAPGRAADKSGVRFETVLQAGGVAGLMNKFFAARLLAPVYADELERLERYAQSQAAA